MKLDRLDYSMRFRWHRRYVRGDRSGHSIDLASVLHAVAVLALMAATFWALTWGAEALLDRIMPAAGRAAGDGYDTGLSVHGGITYASECAAWWLT